MRCYKCGKDKPESEFNMNRSKSRGRSSECKICHTASNKIYSRKTQHRCHRDSWLKRKYGITSQDYNAIYEKQGGVCAICGGTQSHSKRKYLEIDHDHDTGKIRALLCLNCNTTLGLVKESTEILEKAIGYLKTHKTPVQEVSIE